MKTKSVGMNPDTREMQAFVLLSNAEIILIQDAVNLYKGNEDDSNTIKIKKN